MPLPNFFVIGAMKSGTSALHVALKQHPQVFMSPVKEPNYFPFAGQEPPVYPGPNGRHYRRISVWRREDYLALFAKSTGSVAVGEATPYYILSREAAEGIRRNVPDARIIALLRHPAERAYSGYQYMVMHRVEHAPTFRRAIDDEAAGLRRSWHPITSHRATGLYFHQLSAYYDQFPREQIAVFLYDEWNREPETVMRRIFEFLCVDSSFVPALRRHNVTTVPRNRRLHMLARRYSPLDPLVPVESGGRLAEVVTALNCRFNLVPPPPLDPSIRAELVDFYREDILCLQDLIARDLSHWL
ncbi:MAG: sulfotransferase family protein [Capsulimonadaceae bacterium]